ncbi:MAG: hypothetical protein WAU70_02210, partial [Flavobacteriales bacterium]
MFTFRGSLAWHWPRSWTRAESYARNKEPFGNITIVEEGSLSKLDIAIDMKWPYGCIFCPGGLYRGGYLMLGAGWTRSWYDLDVHTVDTGLGFDSHAITDLTTDQLSIRLTGGAEINYRWG